MANPLRPGDPRALGPYARLVRKCAPDVPSPVKPFVDKDGIDWRSVKRLAAQGLPDHIIGPALGISPGKMRGRKMQRVLIRARAEGAAAISTAQWRMAMRGSSAMLRLLGEQILGQRPARPESAPVGPLPGIDDTQPVPAIAAAQTSVVILLPDNGRGVGGDRISIQELVHRHGLGAGGGNGRHLPPPGPPDVHVDLPPQDPAP